MGTFETMSTSLIMPSQDYLNVGTLRFILSCLKEDRKDKLPPSPYVRKDPISNHYFAIDGHNLIAVFDQLGADIEVYITDSATDGLAPTTDAIIDRNNELADKYET